MKYFGTLALTGLILLFISCATPGRMLDWAEKAWTDGDYAQAIGHALNSYTTAMGRKGNSKTTEAARIFLEQRFPEANIKLAQAARNHSEGTETEQVNAWEIYDALVDMNNRTADSRASTFLQTRDFSDDLTQSKALAAQLLYEWTIRHIAKDKRDSYISAVHFIDRIEAILPDYSDIRTLRSDCIVAGRVIVAFSNRMLELGLRPYLHPDIHSLQTEVYSAIQQYIIANDHPDFISFTSAADSMDADAQGSSYFIELNGRIDFRSDKIDDYFFNGTVTLERSLNGAVSLNITRLTDHRRAESLANIRLWHEIEIEFHPKRYGVNHLSSHHLDNQFNDSVWMNTQLSEAESVLKSNHGSARMILLAEWGMGGTIKFLDTAVINGSESREIEWHTRINTEHFLNSLLLNFLNFGDIDISERLRDIMLKQFLSDGSATIMLSNL